VCSFAIFCDALRKDAAWLALNKNSFSIPLCNFSFDAYWRALAFALHVRVFLHVLWSY
jgi:hypothetical protein